MTVENPKKDFAVLRTFLFCLLVLVPAFLFQVITWNKSVLPLVEGALILLTVSFLVLLPPVRSYIRQIPSFLMRVYTMLFFLMCLAQIINIPRTTFPFIPWQMFSTITESHEVIFFQYIGVTKNGQRILFRPEQYFRSISNGRFITDLDNLIKSIITYDPEDAEQLQKYYDLLQESHAAHRSGTKPFFQKITSWVRLNTFEKNVYDLDEREHRLDEILCALGQRYNRRHLDDPVIAIEIKCGKIDISQRPHPSTLWTDVWRTSLKKEEAL